MITFIIKQYGRIELAQLYSPDIAPLSAWKRLKQWIIIHPTLMQELTSSGYNPKQRMFTPLQVRMIVNAIGEP